MDNKRAQEIAKKKRLYLRAKKAKVGEQIICPWCNTIHLKTTYHKVFCTNGKTAHGGNCKDDYWNEVDPIRLQRKEDYKAGKFEVH
jgi:hypothetical protein